MYCVCWLRRSRTKPRQPPSHPSDNLDCNPRLPCFAPCTLHGSVPDLQLRSTLSFFLPGWDHSWSGYIVWVLPYFAPCTAAFRTCKRVQHLTSFLPIQDKSIVWFGILPLLRHAPRNQAVFDGFAKTFLVGRCSIRWDSPLLRHGADMQLRSMVFCFFPTWV